MSRGENRHKATRRRTHARGSARNYLGQRTRARDWREAFIENEIQPVGDAVAAELERQLRADGFDVTVDYAVDDTTPRERGGTDG